MRAKWARALSAVPGASPPLPARSIRRAYSLRDDSTLPPPRFHGFPGWQYPAGMVTADGELLVVYSVNKEDIALTRVALEHI